MTYQAPVRDLIFTLENVLGFDRLEQTGSFEDLSLDLTKSIFEEAGKFASEELAPLNRIGDEKGATLENGIVRAAPGFKEVYAKYQELSFGSLPFDPNYGGQGLPSTLALAMIEFWASANMSWGLCPILTEGAVKAIAAHGTEEQKADYLPKLISGEWTGTMNLTEPQAGTDVGALRTRAEVQVDGSYRIKGNKIFITWGDHDVADNIVHLVLARLPDAPSGTKGISLFIVPKFILNEDGTPGKRNDVTCLKLEEKLGIHASPTCVLEYGENEGAVGYLLGEENRGMSCMFTMMNSARLNVGVQGVALGETAYQQALSFAQERTQGKAVGRPHTGTGSSPIIEHADVRRMLLHMKSHIEAARAICYANAIAADLAEHAQTPEDRAMAKAREEVLTPISKGWSTDIGVEVASIGVQVHGGMGFIEETGAAQHLRDVRITPIYEGTNGIQAADLATRKLGLAGGEATKSLITEIGNFAEGLSNSEERALSNIGIRLREATEALDEAADWLRAQSAERFDNVLGGATPYLRLFGNVVGGYYLAKAASAASSIRKRGEGDKEYLNSKVVLATFFAENILPLSPGLVSSVTSGADTLFATSIEAISP